MKKEKNKMGNFDYKKWVTNYKTNEKSLFEQNLTGSLTGSMNTGSMNTGSMNTGSLDTGSVEPLANNEWDSNLEGCGNFDILPGEIKALACQAFFNLDSDSPNPSLAMWVQNGDCCQGSPQMAQGMPSSTSKKRKDPPPTLPTDRKRRRKKRPTRGLREVKNLIKKQLKKLKESKRLIKEESECDPMLNLGAGGANGGCPNTGGAGVYGTCVIKQYSFEYECVPIMSVGPGTGGGTITDKIPNRGTPVKRPFRPKRRMRRGPKYGTPS